MPVIDFEEALELTDGGDRCILLGNGFSIAQSGNNFTYRNLLDRSGLENGTPIRNVFDEFETTDFEEVMFALEQAADVETAYGNDDQADLFLEDAGRVREALIRAIHTVHPEIQFDIPQNQLAACADFLNNFEEIYTLNYDLLLYWTILNSQELRFSDGFGLGQEVNGFRTFSPEAHCSIYYLHGALHIFVDAQKETQKRVVTGDTIISDIARTIRRQRRLPLFVSEGTTGQKLSKINSVPYLHHAHNKLRELQGSMFVFGHSAHQNDTHVYRAIFSSGISNLVVCVHNPHENLEEIEDRIAHFARRREHIDIRYVDAASVAVWG
ncbi:DUF4917 family protein [Thalassobaculum sp.]|uniref:DUF4917 family protein n=1 Tax=Thalassobaculum sp. TaxID=2022740 RepID=UPI0032EBA586